MLPPRPRLIDWTGERCVPWAADRGMLYEHVHRYRFAASFCTGKRVLDLASGEGYGSAILGAIASEVVGLDIDRASVTHSRLTYGSENIKFIEGSMLDPGLFTDHSFDVVVCFEGLEHVRDHDLLLRVVIGALRTNGLVVISTPDRAIYTDLNEQHNPFHVHEVTRQELSDLLGRHFQYKYLLTQEVATGSVIQALDGGEGYELIRLSGKDNWAPQGSGAPPYLVALASDAPLPSITDVSVLIDTDRLLAQQPADLAELLEEATQQEAKIHRLEESVQALANKAHAAEAALATISREADAARDEQDAQIERLEGSVRALAEESDTAEGALVQLSREMASIKATRGWRALEIMRRPYRQARRLGRPLRHLWRLRRASR